MNRKVNPLLGIIFMHAASNCNVRQIFIIFDPYIVCKSKIIQCKKRLSGILCMQLLVEERIDNVYIPYVTYIRNQLFK